MSSDFPSYEELEARLWAVEHERDAYREALERIAYQHGSPNEHIDYLAGIATEALSRAGGGE